MATVALGLPIFEGREDDDLERFIELYKGYLHSLGINPAAEGGPPTGWEKGMGILRACMKGPAADWYDNNILGRRVKLRNINAQLVHGNEAGFKALAFNAGANVPGNSWVALSGAAVYAGANAAHLVTTVWPDYTLEVNDDIWRLRAGMELTDDQLNYITGPQGGGAIAGGGAGVGHPYVIPLRPCHALMKLRADYPTQQDARRRLHFGNLFQEDSSVRDFYTSVRKNGHLLAFDNQVIRNQFLRGLSPKNVVEVERLGIDRPLDELVNALERVEKSKDEMHRGQKYQEAHRRLKQTKALQSVQEPVILKPVDQHGITQEEMDQMLKKQAETFQAQIWELQKSFRQQPVYKPPVQPVRPKPQRHVVRPKPPRRIIQDHQDPDYDDGYEDYPDGDDPGAPVMTLDDHQHAVDLIMGYKPGTSRIPTKQLQKAKDKRDDLDLARAMRNLDLNDDAMDIDTASFGEKVELREKDGDVYMVRVGSKKK